MHIHIDVVVAKAEGGVGTDSSACAVASGAVPPDTVVVEYVAEGQLTILKASAHFSIAILCHLDI